LRVEEAMTFGHPLLEITTMLDAVSDYIYETYDEPDSRRESVMLVLAIVARWSADELSGEFGDDDEAAETLREAVDVYFAHNDEM
jgi:hypothetical protein